MRHTPFFDAGLGPGIGEPRLEDRDALVQFMNRVALQWPTNVSRPHELCRASSASKWIGQHLGQRQMRLATDVRIDPRRCTAWGTCVGWAPPVELQPTAECVNEEQDPVVALVDLGMVSPSVSEPNRAVAATPVLGHEQPLNARLAHRGGPWYLGLAAETQFEVPMLETPMLSRETRADEVAGRELSEHEVSEAYSKYGPLVLLRCRRILRDETAAEDAMQDVFLRVWRHGQAFREAESKVSWLCRVAERCSYDQAKRRTRRAEVQLNESGEEMEWRPLPGPAATIEDWNLIARLLNRFDRRLQQVALMYYLDEMTQEEIAQALGWSRQTVIKKLEHIRSRALKLRPSLTGEV